MEKTFDNQTNTNIYFLMTDAFYAEIALDRMHWKLSIIKSNKIGSESSKMSNLF